ncbi:nucleoid-associated protein [Salinicola salarius]|uniref:nucleoid-associated protein n=1 Tax=Salinicola salarius TaxID=430457 RepID=UPI0023E357A6|nr:nucleoid-associated protein [Salinicola salarius]MDF3920619.1 nucleoid-associated protein [Salinicola salarius]
MHIEPIVEHTPEEAPGDEVQDQSTSIRSVKPLMAVTAKLEKRNRNQGGQFLSKIGMPWDLNDDVAIDFVYEIEKRFRRKYKKFGVFDNGRSAISRELNGYCENEDVYSPELFISLGEGVMASLSVEADEVNAPKSAGGNIVFMHYLRADREGKGFFLVMLLEKTSMFDFDDENLQPEKLEPINTKAIKQAAMVDLELFTASYPDNDGEAYLTFIEGSSKAAFFKTAMGCSEDIDNGRSISELDRAITDFVQDKALDREVAESIRSGFKALLIEHSKPNSQPLTLELVQSRVDRILPEDNEAVGTFAAYVNDNNFKVNQWFSPTSPQAKGVGKIDILGENNSYTVQVSQNAIGEVESGKPVKLSPAGDYLYIPIHGEKREEIFKLLGRDPDRHES